MGVRKFTEIDIASSLQSGAHLIVVQTGLNDSDEEINVVRRIPLSAVINALVGAGLVTADDIEESHFLDRAPAILIGSTDKTLSEESVNQSYYVNDRYINRNNGKMWICSVASFDDSENKWVYTWTPKGKLIDIDKKLDAIKLLQSRSLSESIYSVPDNTLFVHNGELGYKYDSSNYYKFAHADNVYTKIETDGKYMKLADPSAPGVVVPSADSMPDTTSNAYKAINNGQIFICVINEKITYWIKQSETESQNFGAGGGIAFDSGYVDSSGNIHLTSGGEDIEGFDPFFVGTSSSGTSGGIVLSDVVKPSSVRNGTNAIFSFIATATDDTDITVKWYVDGLLISTDEKISGSSFAFNAKDYLKPSDVSSVRAVITSAGEGSLNRQWNVTSSAFSLAFSSTINPIMLYINNEDQYVVVDVYAPPLTENNVTLTIGNHSTTRSVVGNDSVTFKIESEHFTPGVNTISAILVSGTDQTDRTDPVSFKAIWGHGVESPVAAFACSSLDTVQYDVTKLYYFVFDPDNEEATCTLQIGNDPARSLRPNRTLQQTDYAPQNYGVVVAELTCGSSTDTLTINVSKSQYNIGKTTGDSLVFDLDPTGHNNSDADREQFCGITFSPSFDWENGGFRADSDGSPAFVVKKGHRATLPRNLFVDDDGFGKTIDLSFCIKNSDLYDAVAMEELNNGETKGLILRANEGELRLNNNVGQLFRYCEESRIDLSINVESLRDQRVMTVWLDGVPSQVNTYAVGTLVQNENALVIGSDNCDVWVYAIRVYNTSLSMKQMIQNYVSLAPTTSEKVKRYKENDIYVTVNNKTTITEESLHAASPDLTIVHISADRLPIGKDDADYVSADITIRDGSNLLTLSKEENTRFKDQGTSSMAYGRAAYNMDIEFSGSGKKYALSENSIPVDYLNIKVNVASSECANNICAADWYNTFQPYLVPGRSKPGVRDTVEGKPCAIFFTNTSDKTIFAGSQELAPGETVLYAMGDLCNSKKNKAVFAFDEKGENHAKGCIEVSNNDLPAQQFKETATYNPDAEEGKGRWESVDGTEVKKAFEWRTKPKNSSDAAEVVAAWNAATAWVVSTVGNSAKFKAEVSNHFAIKSLLYHFLYLEFFSAYDNVSKNTFYTYEWDEELQKYVFNICKNYDDDTILGCDNDGVPLSDYGADFGDKKGSRSLFNADTNTIWVNIKEAYYEELASMYLELRGKGAWTASALIEKWENYQNTRPRAAMAQDAYNKYVLPYKTKDVYVANVKQGYDPDYLARMQGPKTYQRRQFLTYQQMYMDGKYGYHTLATFRMRANAEVGTTKNLAIKVYAKTHVSLTVDSNQLTPRKVETGGTVVFPNVPVHSNATIYFSPESLIESVTPIDDIQNSSFAAAGASKLIEAILGTEESENESWDANTPFDVPSPILKRLSIRNIVDFSQALDLSKNVELESVDTRGTMAGIVTLPSFAPLRTVYLNACTGVFALNLNKVETFSMASGSNLTKIRVENCNAVVATAALNYLKQAAAAVGNDTRRIRMTGIEWTLEDTNLLRTIASKWKGYNSLGAEVDTPYLSGIVHINSISANDLSVFSEVFPDLVIDKQNIIPSYPVIFNNYDGEQLWVEYVDRGEDAVDPIENGDIAVPTKPDTEAAEFTFDQWTGGSLIQVTGPVTLTASFTSTPKKYRVRWLNKGSVISSATQMVDYGASAVYSGDIPEDTSEEGLFTYNVFKGWDKSTGFIRGNIDVNAVYQRKDLPQAGTSTHNMTAAEFYGIVQAGKASEMLSKRDRTKIRLGFVPDYLDETGRRPIYTDICNKRKLNGSECIDTGIQPLKGGITEGWTLVCDVEFLATTSEQTMVCCYQEDGSMGFKIKYSNGVQVLWGDASKNLNRGTQREMIVIRHTPGSKNVMLYASNTYAMQIDSYELTKDINSVSNAHLYIGATVTDGGDVGKYANGIMHFCRYYTEDLGDSICRKIANYPTEEYWIELCNFGGYYLTESSVTQTDVDFKFLTCLWKTMQMNTTATNAGGYDATIVGRWILARLLPALPQEWQSILAECRVLHNNYVDGSTDNIVTSNVKMSILDVVEFNSNTTTAPWSECGSPITYYVNDAARIHYQGITTRENYVTFTQGTDPTLDPNNDVQEGDLWVDTSNSNAKKVFDGLVWRAWTAVAIWLRGAPRAFSLSFASVYSNGTVFTGHTNAHASGGVLPRFSIKKRR